MSGPKVVVVPVLGDSVQHPDRETVEIASTIQHALHERAHPEPEHPGPIKQILAHSDSLYKYINWEDPTRTLGVYTGALSILFGAHYLPLTQVALKAGVTTLGVVSVTEFASRSFAANSLSARLRPKEYKKIPESTLNATLKDIHDLIQYAVVQAQRILFGQDLNKTFAAFLGFAALYWLTIFVPPFWLAVIGLTSIFVAPLVFSPQGREIAHDASVQAQELANVAAEKGKVLAQNGKAKAAELSSNGKQTAADLSSKGKQTVADLSSKTNQTAADLSSKGKQTATDLSSKANQTAADMYSKTNQTAVDLSSKGKQTATDLSSKANQTATNFSSKGKQTAAELSAQARGTASDMSGTATENVRKLPQMGTNAINDAQGTVSSAFGDVKGYISTSSSNNIDGNSNRTRSGTGGAASKVSKPSNSADENAKQMAPEIHTGSQPYSDYPHHEVSSFHTQTGGKRTDSVADTDFEYTAAGDTAFVHGTQERPRGAAPSAMDRA